MPTTQITAPLTIAIDAMGGDYGPSVIVPAALRVLQEYPNVHLILVGDESILNKHLAKRMKTDAASRERIMIQHSSEVVAMDESPSQALRYKKNSSMRIAINLVKEGKAAACVSAGNTGALMATARFVLKTLAGINRPAIMAALPTTTESVVVRMLDLGANVGLGAKDLFQFAVMGSVVASAIGHIENPKVGLLNIGVEAIKGNEQVKQTAALLQEHPVVNYIGYVEGDDIYSGIVDVVVCDGFVGNIALKSSEGAVSLVSYHLRRAFNKNFLTRLAGLLVKPILHALKMKIDPARYNGASLIGLQGIVIKSHGGAHPRAFANAIIEAITQAEHNIPRKINDKLAEILA